MGFLFLWTVSFDSFYEGSNTDSLLCLQNMEVEKQIKFFQSCVAFAFAERDSSVIEVRV